MSGPSGGSSGVGRRGGGTATAVDPYLVIDWVPMLLKGRTSTGGAGAEPASPPADAKPADGAPKPADPKEAAAAEESLGLLRGLDLPRDLEKPVFVYFHWPHEDGDRGKRIIKFCNGPLDDQAFVRVTPLFHCVEVNTRDSSQRFVEEAKVRTTPTLLICRPDGTIVWRCEDTSLSGAALAASFKKVLQERFPERWTEVEKERKAQRESLLEARRHLAAKKIEDALAALGNAVGSQVRFTEEWADARKTLAELEKEIAKKEKEDAR